jgi:hypothetical protein
MAPARVLPSGLFHRYAGKDAQLSHYLAKGKK